MAIGEMLAAVLVAYLIGSVSFAVVVSRAMKLPDPRTYGSNNPGATNVLRFFAGESSSDEVIALAAVAVTIGHMYPVFHRFQGGKGVATALGVLLGINLWIGLGAALTWAMIAFFLRISSLSALVAAVSAPVFCFLLYGLHPFTLACAVIAALLIWRHKSNIRNLLAGTEPRIGAKRA